MRCNVCLASSQRTATCDISSCFVYTALCKGNVLHVQDMAKSRPINMKGQRGFKMLILNETDRLSAQAQHSLRRTMEKYSASCRLVLCCNNVSKVRASHEYFSKLSSTALLFPAPLVQCNTVPVCWVSVL